jgi:protein involved in polysaccharide export with SLBB domain
MKILAGIFCVMLFSSYAMAVGDETPSEEILSREVVYEVGPGDVLDIRVYGEEDLSKNFTVNREGELVVPYVGRVSVKGMSVSQIAVQLEIRLLDGFLVDPQVTAQVHEYKAKPVQILGEVKEPGVYYLRGESNVHTILARAGGAPENVTQARVLRERSGSVETFLVDLESLSLGGGTLSLQAGDRIHVLPAARVFVSGEVKEEGAISWREGMTAWQALSKAGGPTRTAKLKGAYVLRQGSTIEVDLKAVKQGKAEDVILRPDDQLVLPESIF